MAQQLPPTTLGGRAPAAEHLHEQWQETWAGTLATNLTGAANATSCAVPHRRVGRDCDVTPDPLTRW